MLYIGENVVSPLPLELRKGRELSPRHNLGKTDGRTETQN